MGEWGDRERKIDQWIERQTEGWMEGWINGELGK